MTNQQEPAALRLAEELEHDPGINRPSVVAELRRLHAENAAAHKVGIQQERDLMAAEARIAELEAKAQELGTMRAQTAPAAVAEQGPVVHDEELLEQMYWEFDGQRRRTGEERLAFKGKMRSYASEFRRRSDGEMTFAQSVSDDMMNLADRLGSEYDDVDPRAWKHLLVYAPQAAQGEVAWPAMPPSKSQSPILFEDGYAEGWAKCLEACKAALATWGNDKATLQQKDQKPYAYAVYFPDQPTVELVHDLDELTDDLTNREHQIAKLYTAPQAAPAAQRDAEDAAQQPRLKVHLTAFPESNGKQNWTALLVRADKWDGLVGNCGGISLARGELWNRVAYAAECARFLIGERDTEPFILDYGDDIKTPEEWKGEVRGGRKPRAAARKQKAHHD